MNDRYLYRAKRTDNREWIVGSLIQTSYLGSIRSWISSEQEDKARLREISSNQAVWRAFEVRTDTICQWTRKTDIENKLIFEHGIVSFLDATSTENGYSERCQVGEVLWDDETVSFQVTERLSAESYEVLEDCKVLGNTIDNPELLDR